MERSPNDNRGMQLARVVGILGVVIGLLLFILQMSNEGLPWSWWWIWLDGVILIFMLICVALSVASHRALENRAPLFGEHGRPVLLALVIAGFCGVAGFDLGSNRDQDGPVKGQGEVRRQVEGVLGKLRRHSAESFSSASAQSDPVLYASRARKLAGVFHDAAAELEKVGAYRSHVILAGLVSRCRQVGDAYEELGRAALRKAKRPGRFNKAKRRLKALGHKLRRAESDLREKGIAIELPQP